MVSVWRRLIYSLLSVLTANVVFASALTLYGILSAGVKAFESTGIGLFKAFSILFLSYFVMSVMLSAVGWILAVPLVLLVKKVNGWRFWMYLGIGAILGPLALEAGTVYVYLSNKNRGAYPWSSVTNAFALVVSVLTTLIFLLLLRRANERAGEPQIPLGL
ncbi:MAG TPA: hypothetical protein VF742_17855 [Terracidiphilus sp.]|jgi:hypothetical protein